MFKRSRGLLLFDNLICERKRSVGGDVLAGLFGFPGFWLVLALAGADWDFGGIGEADGNTVSLRLIF